MFFPKSIALDMDGVLGPGSWVLGPWKRKQMVFRIILFPPFRIDMGVRSLFDGIWNGRGWDYTWSYWAAFTASGCRGACFGNVRASE